MCFLVIVLGKAVYFFSPLPLSKSRLAVTSQRASDVSASFLAQNGLEHFMSTELLSTPQSILPPRSAAGADSGQGGARVAGLSGWAPSGMPSDVDSSIETGRMGGGIAATEDLTLGKDGLKEAAATPLLPPVRPTRSSRSSSRSGKIGRAHV